MAAKRLREHVPSLHSTEQEFDKPKLGDVRVEEGIARDSETGEVLSARWKHPKTGRMMSPGMAVDMETGAVTREGVPSDYVLDRPEQRAHKVYVFEERPDKGPAGLYWHADNESDVPFNPNQYDQDKQGFYLGADGKRLQRFAERGYWALKGEHTDLDGARKLAAKHGAE